MSEPVASRPAAAPRRPRLAIVVGSGGIKCAAAIGMWKVLARNNIDADLVVGCSGGGLTMACMALGMSVADAERHTLELTQGLFGRPDYGLVLRGLLSHWVGSNERFGVINDATVNRAMRILFGDATFADTRVPLYLAATDVHSGEARYLHDGLVRDAARASMAIPLLLQPWPIADALLMDGGVSDPLPVSVAIREGADIILAMGFETPPAERIDSPLKFAGQSLSITVNHLLRATYAFYNAVHHAELVPLMPSFERPIGVTDTDLVPYIIEQGERVTEAELPYIQRLLQNSADGGHAT